MTMTQQVEPQPGNPPAGAPAAAERNAGRIAAIDFAKGLLVVLMVVYHWAVYFARTEFDFRYLRFLTPSFIFITGFLISNVYLSKYGPNSSRLPRRLLQRGLKLFATFAVLNVAIRLITPGDPPSLDAIARVLVAGDVSIVGAVKGVSFYILVPIAYLLFASAGLVVACRVYARSFYVAFLALVLLVFALDRAGTASPNVELLSMGMLGVLCGYIPIARIDGWAKHGWLLVLGYAGYLAAITMWDVTYPLQIAGVILSVLLAYRLGSPAGDAGPVRRVITLSGQYSLFAYIAQIAILQLLRRGVHRVPLADLDPTRIGLLVVAVALTILAVEAARWLRARAPLADGVYRTVFG